MNPIRVVSSMHGIIINTPLLLLRRCLVSNREDSLISDITRIRSLLFSCAFVDDDAIASNGRRFDYELGILDG